MRKRGTRIAINITGRLDGLVVVVVSGAALAEDAGATADDNDDGPAEIDETELEDAGAGEDDLAGEMVAAFDVATGLELTSVVALPVSPVVVYVI